MKDYIVKTTWSLRAVWNTRNTLNSLRKDVYLFIWLKKTREPWTNCQGSDTRSDREGSLIAEWMANTYKDKFRMTTAFLIILFRWKITLLKQRGLCELCEIPETLWIVYVKMFIYLFD